MTLAAQLGIEVPLIQAPMAGVQDEALAIAVSQAGGLGSIPAAMLDAEGLAGQIRSIQAAGVRAFNVNFFCHRNPVPDDAAEANWRATLRSYFAEFGLDPDNIPASPGRAPFDAESLAVVEALRPPVVSFHFGLPDSTQLDRIKACGIQVMSSATSADEVRWLDQHGADVIIAQGLEAGGHRGSFLDNRLEAQADRDDLLSAALATTQKPVVAAGGIGGIESIRQCMAAGAAGVQLGTSYLLCDEATTREVHRVALRDGTASTAITNVFSGRPARGIRNRALDELGPISAHAPAFPTASTALAPLRSAAEAAGRGDFSPLWSGTDASGCMEISAGELTRRLAAAFD